MYSLRDFDPAEVPYEELAELIGYSRNYGFPGQLVLEGDKARSVIKGLRITTRTVLEQLGIEKLPVGGPLPVQRAELEQQHTPVVSFERAAATTLCRREEQPLVMEFCATLAVTAERFRSPVGLCDIFIQGFDSVESIEAKSRTEHAYVREALSQLLDCAPHSPRPVDRLAVPLPDSPDERELQLLHRYGVHCIHRVSPGVFWRVPAPDDRPHLMKRLWTES
ncbi:hypothetical protein [Streptomyces sp. NRRL WC-3744]|uniref:hypothetical protein n=1 Tax=Streptomyces sp. NRRL WC-3744 TaxID=1463935 RepID=UPI0006647CB5|nr:hypothetical protein [Streptomyces sp. NRRL WC-3744]